MRKFAIRSASPADSGDSYSSGSGNGAKGWVKKEWRLIALLAIIAVAFVIRFVFAYGLSAGDNFALSGGSSATSHVHVIESLLNGSFAFTDPALNYPYGTVNSSPVLFDAILAGFAGLASLFGISSGTAAAGALAWSAPILAALTCYPVYLVGKKMFDDEKIGMLSALLYAFFALLVMNTVFSNGSEIAFVMFLFAFMVYFLLKALEACDNSQESGIKGIFKDKAIRNNTIISGVLFLLIALSWNDFRAIVIVLAVIMVLQGLVDRFRSKDMAMTVGVYSLILLIGVVLAAPYYLMAGLWTMVYCGPFVITVLTVALMLFLCFTSSKPWVLMVPVAIIIAAVVFVALFFGANDIFDSVVSGNSLYEGSLMNALITNSTSTVSNMAAYFGWVTLWLPIPMFLYMLYKYRKNADSKKYTFVMWSAAALFCISWYSVSYAMVAGLGFAVFSAAIILMIIRGFALKDYISGLRGNGLMSGLKKAAKPLPLAAVVFMVALILVPNVAYAMDAATSTNDESGDEYFGGLGYTIMTDDSSRVYALWDEYRDQDKSGALVTWLGNSNDAVFKGGFSSVTDTVGGGASAASNILLSDGSASATASMAVRLMMEGNIENYRTAITASGMSYSLLEGYFNDRSTAVDKVLSDVSEYPGVDADLTEENAVYLVVSKYMASVLSDAGMDDFYDAVCGVSGNRIAYVEVDGSMIPMYYGDGSSFSTIAYFADYILDTYNAPSHFYTYNTNTGVVNYTSALYETFLWKSLIGITQTDAGMSSTTALLNELLLSDGTVKAVPGYGLSNYDVAYWQVQYNADDEATLSSDGWTSMDGYEAIALQNEQGGLINYLYGVVLMEYDPSEHASYSGTVNYTTSSGTAPAQGIQVAVFEKTTYDSSGVTNYVQRNTVYTDANGKYTILVPQGVDYYVVFSSGTSTMTGGDIIATYDSISSIPSVLTMNEASISGKVVLSGDTMYTEGVYVVIEGQASGYKAQSDPDEGAFEFENVIPDKYTATVYKKDGTSLATASLTVCQGESVGAKISVSSATISVTVTDEFGASADGGKVIAMDSSSGLKFSADIVDGSATLSVVPSTYSLYAADGKATISTTSVTVSSSGSKTASLKVYDTRNVTVTGAPAGSMISIMSLGFTASATSASSSAIFEVPVSSGSEGSVYTAYAINGDRVYYGTSSGNSISLTEYSGNTVTGTLKGSDDKATSGTVAFINGDHMFVFSADDKGAVNAFLPSGSYDLYAYDSSDALFKKVTVSNDTDLGDIDMVDGRNVTASVLYRTGITSSGTSGIAFVDATLTMTFNNEEYSVTVKSNASGSAVFYVPSGYTAKLTSPGFDTDVFYMKAQSSDVSSGSGSSTITWTLMASESAMGDNAGYVKSVNVVSDYNAELKSYVDSTVVYTLRAGVSQQIPIGRYTAEVDGSTGYYYSGSLYIYPSSAGNLGDYATQVRIATVQTNTGDSVTVTSTDSGVYYQDADDSGIYYLEYGKSFYFTGKSGSSTQESIAYYSAEEITTDITVDLRSKSTVAKMTGYAGAAYDGKVYAEYGSVRIPFEVADGEFEIVVPSGQAMTLTAELEYTDSTSGMTYEYKASVVLSADDVKDGAKANIAVVLDGQTGESVITGSDYVFANGVGSFTLSIKNEGTEDMTYVITSGSAWVLDATCTLLVGAGDTGSVQVSGRYDVNKVGAGDDNLTVIVKDVVGTSVGTLKIPADAMARAGTTATYVDVSGTEGASADSVNGFEYLYAISIKNSDNYLKMATVDVTLNSDNWTFVVADADGIILSGSGHQFEVFGYSTAVIYVKLMSADGTSSGVPSVNVRVTMDSGSVATDSSSVSVSGSVATMAMSPTVVDMSSSDMTAGGDNIFNEASSVPATFWALLALCILMLILIVWLGIKRGVFVRKK